MQLENTNIVLTCQPNGAELTLIDKRRGTRWVLDPRSQVVSQQPDLENKDRITSLYAIKEGNLLRITYQAGASHVEMHYTLHEAYVEVQIPVPETGAVRSISLPGSFSPEGEPLRLLLPIMQGMLWDGRGPAFEALRGEASHLGFTMPFIGYLGSSGGLLLTARTRDDCRWWYGKGGDGRFWASNVQVDSLGSLRYPRSVRIYPTDADIVAVAKRYRACVREDGRFVTWDEKLAARPGLERLFGALMCFIGYCQDDIDYVANFKRLKAFGFDRALVYPVRFNIYRQGIRMGGQPAINLSPDEVAAIKALGYDVAPWSWLNEALDDGTPETRRMFRRNAAGDIMKHWAIDDQQWYHVCYSFIEAFQEKALQGQISDISWDHFDVLACVPPLECYALDHPHHLGHPLSRTEERAWIRRVFQLDQARGLAVSSENFNDAYAMEQDLGSVKAWPQYGPWLFWPVPLTMLVYHDSMIHAWWEVHNYNSPWFGRTRAGHPFFEYGGGRPRLMAALDALMGCPPDVLPFGAQYGWTGRGTETYLYKFRFDDPEVQIALREALPVAKLHGRIGKQEMVHFKILSDDGYVQESAFADGTRVIANFSRDTVGSAQGIGHAVLPGVEALQPESWVAVK